MEDSKQERRRGSRQLKIIPKVSSTWLLKSLMKGKVYLTTDVL